MIQAAPLARILRQNIRRNLRHIVFSSIGIVIGIAAFVFFWALSAGVSRVVLHDIFPIDRVEVIHPKTTVSGKTAVLDDAFVAKIHARPEVKKAFPKMKLLFPAAGIVSILGNNFRFEVGGFCDGIDPVLVADEPGMEMFKDWEDLEAGKMAPCPADRRCPEAYYCSADDNLCHHKVPVLGSRTIVEIYNASFAPSHGLPKLGKVQERAFKELMKKLSFVILLGESVFELASAKINAPPRRVEAMAIGLSDKAMPIGMTVPIGYVRRWNSAYVGAKAAETYSSVVVDLQDSSKLSSFIPWIRAEGFENEESQAERISLIITVITALFLVIAFTIMFISAVNISHTFFMVVSERRKEIGLMRALGASRWDIMKIILGEAAIIGFVGGALGVGTAFGLARLIDYFSANQLPDFPFKPTTYFAFSPALFAAAFAFAVLFCIVGATLPARKAARIHPAQALSG